MADDEIDVLWHGRWVLQDLIGQFGPYLRDQQKDTLYALIVELDRIRQLRVQRQTAHRRAKQKRRAQAIPRKVL